MHPLVLSYRATRLAAAEPTAFFLHPSDPPMCYQAAHEIQFYENHFQLVVQAPQNHSKTGTRSGSLLPHVIRSVHHYSGHEQSSGKAWGHSATNATPKAAKQAQGLQCADNSVHLE